MDINGKLESVKITQGFRGGEIPAKKEDQTLQEAVAELNESSKYLEKLGKGKIIAVNEIVKYQYIMSGMTKTGNVVSVMFYSDQKVFNPGDEIDLTDLKV